MIEAPPFEFDREDTYMYFASNMLPDHPVIVEVGSIHGAHGIKLCKKFDNKLTMIAYEAGRENFDSLVIGLRNNIDFIGGSGGIIEFPIINYHRAAVTGSDGEVEFFEFEEISSNSIYPRHTGEGRRLRRTSKVRSVSLDTVISEDNLVGIDLLFLNCEGAELGVLKEVLAKPKLRNKLGQLCVSFHGGRIYHNEETRCMVSMMSEFFWVVEEKNDWPCHLFVNKNLGR